jgi:hypothetical protein
MIRRMEWTNPIVQQRELHQLELSPETRRLRDLIMEETKVIVKDGHVFIGGIFKAEEIADCQRPVEAQVIVHGHAAPEELICFTKILCREIVGIVVGQMSEEGGEDGA